MQYDIIHIAGKPHVLVPLHDYTQLKNGAETSNLPDDVLHKIAIGTENPIKIIRKYRAMTQDDLASAAGLSRPYLTEIETGRKEGSIRSLKSIAKALNVALERVA